MISDFIKLFRATVPYKIRIFLYNILICFKFYYFKKQILKYYKKYPEKILNDEQIDILSFLRKNALTSYPYSFIKKYNPKDVNVYFDEKKGLRYVLFDNKKLFFKKGLHPIEIRNKFYSLQIEQDIDSPHRYITDTFSIEHNDVVVDVGSSEANFALSIVEKVKKLILIETDSNWINALEATFEPWSEKVMIINKFVTNTNESNCITLDNLIYQIGNVDFIKIDVDGEESKLIEGFKETLNGNLPLKIALCTYHKENDDEIFSKLLLNYRFNITFSKGYMIFMPKNILQFPYLRKGLIRAFR